MMAGPEAEFFLFQRRDGESHDRRRTTRPATSTWRRSTRARTCAARSCWRSSRWASWSRPRITRWRPGSTRSTSATTTCWRTADNVSTFRFVVKNVAQRNGLHATFMPKPIFGVNGIGHAHAPVAASRASTNAFFDADREWQLSETVPALHRRAAAARARLLRHHQPAGELVQAAGAGPRGADGDRLVGEEPQPAACASRRRAASARAWSCACPIRRCNPYLALAVMLRAGLDGVVHELDPGPPVNKNIYKMSHRERRHLRIDDLPANLSEALDELEKSDLVRDALGEHIVAALPGRQARASGTNTSATCRRGSWTAICRSTDRPGIVGSDSRPVRIWLDPRERLPSRLPSPSP